MRLWLEDYEAAHFVGFTDVECNARLDARGIALAKSLQGELQNAEVCYFSSANMIGCLSRDA
jgi:hypothetical protein